MKQLCFSKSIDDDRRHDHKHYEAQRRAVDHDQHAFRGFQFWNESFAS